jgi:hypothetical protein
MSPAMCSPPLPSVRPGVCGGLTPSLTQLHPFVALIMAVALSQTFLMFRKGAKWMSAMTIGAYCFAVGIGSRFGLHAMPDSKGIYIAEYLFVVLSPCAFIAACV